MLHARMLAVGPVPHVAAVKMLAVSFRVAFIVGVIVVSASGAHADSGDDEAQIRCDAKAGAFSVRPYYFDEDNVPLDHGFERVSNSRVVNCHLGKVLIEADIELFPPAPHHCRGGGDSILKSLSVNGRQLVSGDVGIGAARSECEVGGRGEEYSRLSEITTTVSWPYVLMRHCIQRGAVGEPPQVHCKKMKLNLNRN